MHSLLLLIALGSSAAQTESPPPTTSRSDARGLGVGVQTTLPGAGPFGGTEAGISVAFDQAQWRISTLLNVLFVEDNFTAFRIGGRFFYRLHKVSMADFSVGAGVGFEYVDNQSVSDGLDDELLAGYFEALGQIRVFVVRNVSVNANLGFGFRVGDGSNRFGLTGQANGGFGITYFFE